MPLNNAVPVAVSTDTTSDVPSVILNDLLVPPLNTKSPPPLVSKFRGTSKFDPADFIVFVLSKFNVLVEGPIVIKLLAGSTLKNGVIASSVLSI